jgi:hypothetical protein
MPTLWTWQAGRQGSGYEILTLLWSTRLREGGELACERSVLRLGGFNPFRPDLPMHSVCGENRHSRRTLTSC